MARIVISNQYEKTLEVNDLSKTLLQHFHDQSLDWMHACGGRGCCTTCKAIIIDGKGNFQPPEEAEIKYSRMGALGHNERLCCQARITGDVVIAVPDVYKLPHVKYSY